MAYALYTMVNRLTVFVGIALLLSVVGCVPPVDEVITTVDIDRTDPTYQRLYNYIDNRQVDSVLAFTGHPDPAYRYTMAMGMASIQHEKSVDSLVVLLSDPVLRVRSAAAYALGQLGSPAVVTPLVEAFTRKDTIDVDNSFNASILEAIGKTAGANMLKAISTVTTYRKTDTLLLAYQAQSIYRFGLRNLFDDAATKHMVELVLEEDYPLQPRIYAAKYLSRFADKVDLTEYESRLVNYYVKAAPGEVRLAITPAVVGLGDPTGIETILSRLRDSDTDYRERVEILRKLGSYPYIQVVDDVLARLGDDNLHVAHAAADYLAVHGNPSDAALYPDYIQADMRFSVKAKLYGAVLQKIPVYYTNTKNKLKREMLAALENADLQQEKVAYMRALSKDPYAYPELITRLEEAKIPVIRSTIAQGLSDIVQSDNFLRAYRSGLRYHTQQIVNAMHAAMQSGDAGVVTVASAMLSGDQVDWERYITDSLDFYKRVRSSLSMPGQIEPYNEISKVIAKIERKAYEPVVPTPTHPITWKYLANYGDSAVAVIKTSKGNISIRLAVADAPATVANFIGLALDDYYDGKTTHRVVSNFVVQGGCSRGDGYGGLNYTIRSELGQLYYDGPGYVGMASAGPDTEGTQWFITHSATPHLDGRYSIFGRVIEGMDVVHKLMPGDITYDVVITKA